MSIIYLSLLIYSFQLLFPFSQCAIIWQDPFNTTNGEYANWTVESGQQGSVSFPPSVNISNCPNNNYCWELKESFSISHTHSTANYENIALTWSISGKDLDTTDYCEIYVTVGSTFPAKLVSIYDLSSTFPDTQTVTLPVIVSNKNQVSVQLQSTNINDIDYCYFSDIMMEGDVMNPSTGWQSPASTLLRVDGRFAAGIYNDSIFLIGGFSNRRQVTEYTYRSGTFIGHGPAVLTMDVYGDGQFWSQKNEMLYVLEGESATLGIFNMKTLQYTSNWTMLHHSASDQGCLVVLDDHLYVIGGSNLNTTQILNISASEWMDNTPDMNEGRGGSSCVAHYGNLWVFGGYRSGPSTFLMTNERIGITNITVNNWTYIVPLSIQLSYTRAIAWRQNIFIIGGGYPFCDLVHIVDVETFNVTLSPERLVYKVGLHAVTLKNDLMYVFGGGSTYDFGTGSIDFPLNTWMSYELPLIPTSDPTLDPTTGPTFDPIIDPTVNPTVEPTHVPTESPTKDPTTDPTNNPTPANAVSTNYEIKIDINCQNTDGDGDDDTDNTECDTDIDPDVLNDVIATILIAQGSNVQILSTEIVNNDLVIHLSITTGPHNVLQPDIISDRIEAEIQDNDDFGDVETEKTDDELNDTTETDEHPIIPRNTSYIMIAIGTVITCVMCCMAIWCYYRKKTLQLKPGPTAQLVKIMSLSSRDVTDTQDHGTEEEEPGATHDQVDTTATPDNINTAGTTDDTMTFDTNDYAHNVQKSIMDNLGELKDLPNENDEDEEKGDVALDLLVNGQGQDEDDISDDDSSVDLMYDNVIQNGADASVEGATSDVTSTQGCVTLQKPSTAKEELMEDGQTMGGIGAFGGFGSGGGQFETIFETKKGDKDNDDMDDNGNNATGTTTGHFQEMSVDGV